MGVPLPQAEPAVTLAPDPQHEHVLAIVPEPVEAAAPEPARRDMILHTTSPFGKDELYPVEALVYPVHWGLERPTKREECLKQVNPPMPNERPCPWITCKHHLFIEASHRGKVDVDVATMKHTCVLDIADDGGITLEEIGEMFGRTRERVRQIEEQTLKKLKKVRRLAVFNEKD